MGSSKDFPLIIKGCPSMIILPTLNPLACDFVRFLYTLYGSLGQKRCNNAWASGNSSMVWHQGELPC